MNQLIEYIDKYHLEDMNNPKHPASYVKQKNYDFLILRFPKFVDKNMVGVSYPFILTGSKYFFYNRESKQFQKFETLQDLHNFLDDLMDVVLDAISKFHIEIEDIEEKLYSNTKVKSFNTAWFWYKKSLIVCDRVLMRSNDAMKEFLNNYEISDLDLKNGFDDIGEHIQRAERSTSHAIEKLDAIYNFHQNIANERMNKTIYLLTILSGIFLPLNLIVGFFGMNTSDLPLSHGSGGSYSVMILLFSVFATAASLLYYFRIKR